MDKIKIIWKNVSIKSSITTKYEILYDFYLEDYRQQKDEIIYNIKEAITAKVLQRFSDIGFQLIDIEIIIKL